MTDSKTRIRRWDVFRADLDPIVGSEQGGRRPVVIISTDDFNDYMRVVTAVPLTKLEGKRRRPYRFEAVLPVGALTPGITSVVLTQQIRTISKLRLASKVGRIIDEAQRAQIEAKLLQHLGIESY